MKSIENIKGSDGSGNAVTAVVQAPRAASATTIVPNSVSGINPAGFYASMGTPHTFTDPITSETITVISEATAVDFRGHIDGANIEIDETAPGYVDNGSEVGDIVIIRPTTEWSNNIAEVLETSHKDDGTLKDGIVDTQAIGDGAVSTVQLAANAVTAEKIDDEAITLAYQQLTSSTGVTGTSYIDVSGLSVTVTVPTGGRFIEVIGFASAVSTTAAENVVRLSIRDGSDTVVSSISTNVRSGTTQSVGSVTYIRQLSAGSYTFKLSVQRDVNTGTTSLAGSSTAPAFITARLV